MQVQSENQKTLKISNLKKKFSNGKVAVDNLNLEMYSDQIFSLLGHNGAGKTTTISMISGMLVQSAGKIELFGYDSSRNKDFMKAKLGVCPQKNPIFKKLTVLEHLFLYSKIKFNEELKLAEDQKEKKKYDFKAAEQEIETLLRDIDLWDKRKNLASELSGGQKRKLCVAIAFVGGSQVILLDEPTSGMDTFARRHLWEMLKLYKTGRIIILTTHNMDEADYLGDRIGIMSAGKQVTSGSSMFLKNKFGVGYILNIIKNQEKDGPRVLSKIREYLPQAEVISEYGLEMKVQLTKGQNHQFKNLFEHLENFGQKAGVKEFGISQTTMEDVFLKVGNLFNEEVKDDLRLLQEEENEQPQPDDAFNKLRKQVSTKENEQEIDYKKLPSKKNKIQFDQELINQVENGNLVEIQLRSKTKIWFYQLGALMKKRLLYLSRDKGGIICEIVLPLVLVILGLALTKLELVQTSPSAEMNPDYLKATKFRINDNSDTQKLAEKIEKSGLTKEMVSVNDILGLQNVIFENPSTEDVFDFYLSNSLSSSEIYYNVFFNTTHPNSPLVASSVFNDAIFKLETGNDDAYIKTFLEPMPNTIGLKEIDNTADSINIAIIFSLAFAFIPTSIILFFIKERTSGAKYQQVISGMSLSAFWCANFIIDFVKVNSNRSTSLLR